jgi:UDP-N-acetylmuramyl tripeptide synthase
MTLNITDSRRLTGPNLLLDRAGVILEVELGEVAADTVIAAWQRQARRLLDAVGWSEERTAVRTFPGGASLAFTAPIDVLYAATEVNEAAWHAAVAEVQGEELAEEEASVVARLQGFIDEEQRPALVRLREAAHEHDVSFLVDDDVVSVGLGTGSQSWPVEETPAPEDIDWEAVHDIPVVLVTGTNGKSTTVRLLARLCKEMGQTPGLTSTDFIKVGDDIIEEGDFSGPGGARTLLRDRKVDVALLEIARGGMLRRGLPVERADAALITNVAEDHLGEYGIETLDDLSWAKLVVNRAVREDGLLVLNADDPVLTQRAEHLTTALCWFSVEAENPIVQAHVREGKRACFVRDGTLVFADESGEEALLPVADIPITLSGAARHNVANSLGVVCLAKILGLNNATIASGLRAFHNDPSDNPGRTNFFEINGVQVLVDFAHNPHGINALIDTVSRIPANRRLVTLGQAGDRSDEDIRNLARAAWQLAPDCVVLMGLPGYERGRAEGEVPGLLRDELLQLGADADAILRAHSCIDAVKTALDWATPGDLLLLLVLTQRDEVFALLETARPTAPA